MTQRFSTNYILKLIVEILLANEKKMIVMFIYILYFILC